MAWKSFELPQLPPGIETASGTLTSITGAITTSLNLLKNVLEFLSSLEVLTLGVTQTLVKTALAAIEAAIESLLNDTGVYLLMVPVRKKVVISPVVQAALSAVGAASLPTGPIPSGFLTLQTAVDRSIYNADGGNAGFTRTVIESLVDTNDPNRPQLLSTDAVTGFYIVAGAASYTSLLGFSNGASSLFGAGRANSSLEAYGLPIPQGVRSRLVASKTSSEFQALIEWEFQQPLITLPTLSTTCLVTQYAVIRSTNPAVLTANSVKEIFGKTDLSVGDKVGTADNLTEVLAVEDYTGLSLKSTYYDAQVSKSRAYYYAVSYNMKTGDFTDIASGGGTETGFCKLSNVCKLYSPERAVSTTSTAGTPPDWVRLPRVMDLIPGLSAMINQFLATLLQMGSFTSGYGDMLKNYTKYLEGEIKNFEAIAADIAGALNTIVSLLDFDTESVGVHFRTFAGVGGNDFLIQDLQKALASNNPDEARPKFNKGTEFVTGVVVLAAAPSAALLAPVELVLNQLFGGSAANPSVFTQLIEDLDGVITAAESTFFTADLGATHAATAPEVARTTNPLIGDDDDGTKDMNCPMPVAANIVFADDFSVNGAT